VLAETVPPDGDDEETADVLVSVSVRISFCGSFKTSELLVINESDKLVATVGSEFETGKEFVEDEVSEEAELATVGEGGAALEIPEETAAAGGGGGAGGDDEAGARVLVP